jgi:hypothetical protein
MKHALLIIAAITLAILLFRIVWAVEWFVMRSMFQIVQIVFLAGLIYFGLWIFVGSRGRRR